MTNIEMFQEHNIDCSRQQARESEPKDYNISTDPVRNLKRATYDRLASITDGVCILIHSPYRFYMFSQLEYQYWKWKLAIVCNWNSSHCEKIEGRLLYNDMKT